jgi:hypothetical protein
MTPRSRAARLIHLVLVVALVVATNPAFAAAPARLEGSIVADSPLAGARIELADRQGNVVAAAPVAQNGGFDLASVPAGTYRLAVTTPKGAYAVGSAVILAPGSRQNVQIAVKESGTGGGSGSGDFWGTTWGKVAGVAILVGGVVGVAALVDNGGDDAPPAPASPSEPLPGR